MEKRVENKIINILENELPRNIANLISNVNNENNQIEYEQIKHICKEIEYKLTERLIDECRIPENMASNFTNNLFDINSNEDLEQIRKVILQSREQKEEMDVQTITVVIRNSANKLEMEDPSKIAEGFTSFSRVSNQIECDLNENIDNSKTLYQIEDIIQNEMLYKCKKWVFNAEFRNDIDIIDVCKRTLIELTGKIQENYTQNGKNILDNCNQKIEDEVNNAVYSCLDELNKMVDENQKENVENIQEEKQLNDNEEIYDENGYKTLVENDKVYRYDGDFIVDVRNVEELQLDEEKESLIDEICEKAEKTEELETLYNELKKLENPEKEISDFI